MTITEKRDFNYSKPIKSLLFVGVLCLASNPVLDKSVIKIVDARHRLRLGSLRKPRSLAHSKEEACLTTSKLPAVLMSVLVIS